ncbi:MAG: alpha/beta fold hydrolase [Planctomycetota bacterium]
MPRNDLAMGPAVLAACCAICLAGSSGAMAGDTFTSGTGTANQYAIERFPEKPDTTKRMVVVLVHGTDGLRKFGGQLRSFAKDLAGRGYLVVLPNYFGKDDNAEKNGTPVEEVQRLSDAIKWAVGQPDVDKGHIGLVGYSLGAALALRYAETNPPSAVQVIVDNYGPTDATDTRMSTTLGLTWKIVEDAPKLPPTLILHNRKDEIVKIRVHSDPLAAALRKAKVESDFISYDDGDPEVGFHPFLPGSKADMDSKEKMIDWLKKHL